jgi:hypothetical protein
LKRVIRTCQRGFQNNNLGLQILVGHVKHIKNKEKGEKIEKTSNLKEVSLARTIHFNMVMA